MTDGDFFKLGDIESMSLEISTDFEASDVHVSPRAKVTLDPNPLKELPPEEIQDICYELFGQRLPSNMDAMATAREMANRGLTEHIEVVSLAMDCIEADYDGITDGDYNVWAVEDGIEVVCEYRDDEWQHVETFEKSYLQEMVSTRTEIEKASAKISDVQVGDTYTIGTGTGMHNTATSKKWLGD